MSDWLRPLSGLREISGKGSVILPSGSYVVIDDCREAIAYLLCPLSFFQYRP